MPLQNRVNPTGEIVAASWRGLFTGNRGCLHDAAGRLGAARWRHANWVCCLTEFRGRHRDPMPPGRWTALFFWDEPCALAAGHRPCGECRRADYRRFFASWEVAGLPGSGPKERDRVLHEARIGADRRQRRFHARAASLPDGVLVLENGVPALLWHGHLWPWRDGYHAPAVVPSSDLEVLTPWPTIEVLRAGYAVTPWFGAEPDPPAARRPAGR